MCWKPEQWLLHPPEGLRGGFSVQTLLPRRDLGFPALCKAFFLLCCTPGCRCGVCQWAWSAAEGGVGAVCAITCLRGLKTLLIPPLSRQPLLPGAEQPELLERGSFFQGNFEKI